ncbi:L-threonylcarbamoyladenylate synthase [Candidatus Liberibacter asiaticus]|nr:L-threonylcarbamoyladenylate synthase [Candidatus Liberibacter asiaticus]BAP26327.1 YrdC/Sua5 family protein [Candidatus Liberibacter asiaticus str. Ishi-1]ALK07169.1 threonylcarbamoyl-AMP synthase [Candidatus Liberibacter asiaticus]AWL13971.1 threonylcarbamoyl-AMP synthase [Candidatus Liberibacter asiaticus]KAE9510225.1 Threonylcarbamoyl-AMP synthase [Candidatus Liberibacter asiaticus]KAE9510995.1 Threonylcarbamoyl-AMP synthase [Candidatus Liberibacter asiaticus]
MMQIMSITDSNALRKACEFLDAGLPIAIPTETVYGLAVDSRNPTAIRRLYEIKKRPAMNPLICHVSDISMVKKHASVDPLSLHLAKLFWPGPLTLVLDLLSTTDIHPLSTANLKTACFRVPCGFTKKLIETYGHPLAIPSANRSGQISITNVKHILSSSICKEIPLIIDGGISKIGLESTIVNVQCEKKVRILRPGGLEIETLKRAISVELEYCVDETSTPQSPGMLKSHYAPRSQVRLRAIHVNPREALIRFGNVPIKNIENAIISLNLSKTGKLKEAAFNLFNYMKIADDSGASSIAFSSIPNHGLGIAINNRLERAAAPRNQSQRIVP